MKVINYYGEELWVEDKTVPEMFRVLTNDEKVDFREWAKDHLEDKVQPIWHPIAQDTILRKRAKIITHKRKAK